MFLYTLHIWSHFAHFRSMRGSLHTAQHIPIGASVQRIYRRSWDVWSCLKAFKIFWVRIVLYYKRKVYFRHANQKGFIILIWHRKTILSISMVLIFTNIICKRINWFTCGNIFNKRPAQCIVWVIKNFLQLAILLIPDGMTILFIQAENKIIKL